MGMLAAQHVRKADASIEQGVDRQLRTLANAIPFARLLEVPHHRFMADIQDPGDLPIGLAAGSPGQALALAVREAGRRAHGFAHLFDPSGRFERECSNQLEQRQTLLSERLIGSKSEGA